MINIKKEILNAKETHRGYFHKNFFSEVPSWEEFLNCLFQEVQSKNPAVELLTRPEDSEDNPFTQSEKVVGNVIIIDNVYFSPQINHIDYFKTLKNFQQDFMKTSGISIGVSGPKISVGPRLVHAHSDPWDAFSLQCQGSTVWTVSNKDGYKEEFLMEPGDFLFFPKEAMHELYCEEPRAGIIFNTGDVSELA